MVNVRFFAGARDAAGTDLDVVPAARTVGELRAALVTRHAGLATVLPRCSLLVDGVRRSDDAPLAGTEHVDVLPPFAGG